MSEVALACRFTMLEDGPGSRAMSEAEATLDELASARVTIVGAKRKRVSQGTQRDVGDVRNEKRQRKALEVAVSPAGESARAPWAAERICTSPAQDQDRVITKLPTLARPRNLGSVVQAGSAHSKSRCNRWPRSLQLQFAQAQAQQRTVDENEKFHRSTRTHAVSSSC